LLKLSVITPTLNQGKFIERTIRSVLDQGYENLEYMIVDGGSTDETLEVIERYADRIDWWISEPDEGQTDAINKGLERATGDVIAYLNSDDYYLPGAFETAIGALERSDASWVAGAAINVDENDRPGPNPVEGPEWIPKPPHSEGRGPELFWIVAAPWGVAQPAAFWRRELFERFGPFRRDMHFAFDVEFMSRLALEGELPVMLPEDHLAARVYHEDAKSSDTRRWEPEYELMRRLHRRRLPLRERMLLRRWERYGHASRLTRIKGWIRFGLVHPVIRFAGKVLDLVPERIRPKIRTRDRRAP
jgi:glycosyltransferase involved in cell wall biosynthesis